MKQTDVKTPEEIGFDRLTADTQIVTYFDIGALIHKYYYDYYNFYPEWVHEKVNLIFRRTDRINDKNGDPAVLVHVYEQKDLEARKRADIASCRILPGKSTPIQQRKLDSMRRTLDVYVQGKFVVLKIDKVGS